MLTSSFLFIFNQTSTTEIYTLPYTTLFRSKLGCPDKLVVGVVGDYSFEFLMEEVAVAVQYKVPYVLVMVNNGYMGLIRQSELPYEMDFGVDLSYDGPSSEAYGMDHVAVMEAMGAMGRRVTR